MGKFLQFVTEINVDAASVTDGNCRAALLRLPNVRDADCTAVSYGGNGGAGGCAHVRVRWLSRSVATSNLLPPSPLTPHPSPLSEFNMTFKAWPRQPMENNLHHHSGNPPLSAFTCDVTSVTPKEVGRPGAGLSTTCAIQDIQAIDAPE